MKDAVSTTDRGLMRVVRFSSALSLGLMTAFLYSIKQVTPELRWELSFGSGIAFLAGAAFSWAFWRVAFRQDDSGADSVGRRRRRRWFLALSVLLSLATAAAFPFALTGVGNDKLLEIIQGTLIAAFALSGIGFVLWQTARFLERDSRRTPQTDEEKQDPED